jgi:hypothetical protein
MAQVAAQGDLIREFLIQILNDCADTLLAPSVRFRIRWMNKGCIFCISAKHSNLLSKQPWTALTTSLFSLYVDLIDQAGKLTCNLAKKQTAKPSPQRVDTHKSR